MDEQTIKERSRADAEEAVRSALLLEAVAKKEKVEVPEVEVEKRLAEIAAQRGQNVARVRAEYEKEGRLAGLKSAIREEKTLDLLMARAILQVVDNPDEPTSDDGETTGGTETVESADPPDPANVGEGEKTE
jgi:trigger factor